MSAENLNYRLQRNPGSSLTWHDGRSQRPAGGRTVKLLQQPGTEGSQVPATPGWGVPFLPLLQPVLGWGMCSFGLQGPLQHPHLHTPFPVSLHEIKSPSLQALAGPDL